MTPGDEGEDQSDKRSSTSSAQTHWMSKNPLRPTPTPLNLERERTDLQIQIPPKSASAT
jgi:hypothetical protein